MVSQRRVGLRVFPKPGRNRPTHIEGGNFTAQARQFAHAVALENVVFYSTANRTGRRGQQGLQDYLEEIAISYPNLFSKLLSALLTEQVREEFQNKGLPIPSGFKRRQSLQN